MDWIDELEVVSALIENSPTLEQAAPWVERRQRLCQSIPPDLAPELAGRLLAVQDRGSAAIARFQQEAAQLRQQLSEGHRAVQLIHVLEPPSPCSPQEIDCRA